MEFDQIVRPRMEAQERRTEELRRRDEANKARQRAAVMDDLERRKLEASIDLTEAQTLRASVPPAAPTPYRSSPLGILDTRTGQITTPAPPKERAPVYRETYTGRTFDIADPAQRAEYDRIQSSGPRDRQGRFISRADERASARADGGGGEEKSAKAMAKDVETFERTKAALRDATARGDRAMIEDLRKRLQTQATNLASRYGDRLEVGGGDWPYQKPRGGQPAQSSPQASTSRATAKRKLMAAGFGDAEADRELDRLGIR
jgi:hypothetical protein